ncbi:MAG: error-prone polymerase [Solirubrobacteraceae bacterium]|nr:error-prone polymerase [Solirubrobacteraceae bacterium]
MFVSDYVELHAHSAFSFLDGASLPHELAAAAHELGHDALALTDHNSVSGSMEWAEAAAPLGLRALHGAEVDIAGARHLTLLVRDARGWGNLCRLLTRAHARTREGRPGAPVAKPELPLDAVLHHADGLVCLSGCATHGVEDEPTARRLLDAFGLERFRVELQRPYLPGDRARNRRRAALARRLGVPCVATGNVHAHSPARARLQDAFVTIREHTTLDASEPLRRGNSSHVLTTPAAMAARFADDHADSVAETARLAETLEFDLKQDLGYRYPGAEDAGADRALAEVCAARFTERYPARGALRDEAERRLEEELRVIAALGLAGFFLLHRDMLELAREVALEVRGPDSARAVLPPGRGRGSSCSSLVCYLVGLSHVDPIENELLLGRFLNEELSALPDIDLDFPRDIREVLIPRVHERYGRERSALVAAFPTFRSRGAIRELGKALGLPPGEIERVARGSESWAPQVERDIASALGPRRGRGGRWEWLARLTEEAYGLPRHLSQHSGGMIVATRPLVDCCPVVPAAMEGRQIAQWDKDSCADAGFLKIDLLGLGMLSAVERSVELIARTKGHAVDLSRIPYDDPEVYRTIQEAETTGVFQIESRAQMQSLRRTRPETLDDLTIQVAIVRPGPIQGGAVNPYIERRQRMREDPDFEIPYEHPSLEPVLRDTLGTIIFQDQVMEVAQAFAGFSPGEAEGLRRAMSRKRSQAAIEAYHLRFIEGARKCHGVDEATAERVYAMIVGFSGFGFPKAHGAAFGLLAYQSTWLRVHHPAEFLCSLLNEQPMGFYVPDALVHEAQRREVAVAPPEVGASGVECTVEEGGRVRLGLGYVRGVRREEVAALVAAREAGGPFTDLGDLAARAGAGRAALAQLAWAGACDALAGGDRRVALWRLGVAAPGRAVPGGTQLALPLDVPAPPPLKALDGWQTALADYSSTGVTTREHPLALLRASLPRDAVTSRELETLPHGRRVRTGGLVVARQRPGTAKGVVFLLVEDEHGTINLIVPPPVYERYRLVVRTEPLVLIDGTLERFAAAGGAVNVLVRRVVAIDAPDARRAEVKDFSPLDEQERRRIEEERARATDFRAVAPAVMSFAAGRRR